MVARCGFSKDLSQIEMYGYVFCSIVGGKSHTSTGGTSVIKRRNVYLWIRDLHLYFGLFISPFILVFAVSTLSLSHRWKPWGNGDRPEGQKIEMSVDIPTDVDGVAQAKEILKQVGVTG